MISDEIITADKSQKRFDRFGFRPAAISQQRIRDSGGIGDFFRQPMRMHDQLFKGQYDLPIDLHGADFNDPVLRRVEAIRFQIDHHIGPGIRALPAIKRLVLRILDARLKPGLRASDFPARSGAGIITNGIPSQSIISRTPAKYKKLPQNTPAIAFNGPF